MYEFYKECASSLKKAIINKYGSFINNDKIEQLNNKNYVKDEIMSYKRLDQTYNYLLDDMLNDLIDINISKEIQLDEDSELYIPCGETFKNIILDYYKIVISRILNFKPYIKIENANKLDLLNFINQEYDNIIDKNIFKKDLNELLEIEELTDFINETIEIDINNFLGK